MMPGSLIVKLLLVVAILGILAGIGHRIRESGKDAIRIEWAAANEKERQRLELERQTRNTITEKREAENATAVANLESKYRDALIVAAGVRKPSSDQQAQPLSSAALILGCPDRQADIAGGLERLEVGVLALLQRGDRAIVRTETCRAWVEEQRRVAQ